MTESKAYTCDDAHELLCAWGEHCVREESNARGYQRYSIGIGEVRSRPAQVLGPTDLTPVEFRVINATIAELPALASLVVQCYYQPGRLQFSGLNGYGRQRGVSERNVAEALGLLPSHVHAALVLARETVAQRLTNELG